MTDTNLQAETFKIESKTRRFILMYAFGLVVGIVALYFYVDLLGKLQNYVTLVLVIPLFMFAFGESTVWLRRGVRIVEIDSTGLTIHRAGTNEPTRIDLQQINDIQIGRSMDGTIITILLGGASSRSILWMTFYSGPHIQIKDQMFDKRDFAELVRRITAMQLRLRRDTPLT